MGKINCNPVLKLDEATKQELQNTYYERFGEHLALIALDIDRCVKERDPIGIYYITEIIKQLLSDAAAAIEQQADRLN